MQPSAKVWRISEPKWPTWKTANGCALPELSVCQMWSWEHPVIKRNHCTMSTKEEEVCVCVCVCVGVCVCVCVCERERERERETGHCNESSKADGRVWSTRNACNHRNMIHHGNMSKHTARPEQWSETIASPLATLKTHTVFLEVRVALRAHHHATLLTVQKSQMIKKTEWWADWSECGLLLTFYWRHWFFLCNHEHTLSSPASRAWIQKSKPHHRSSKLSL